MQTALTSKEKESVPTFSFNIPTLNAGEYIDSCLKSIFSQDYPREKIEVLIADGGSIDDTLLLARKYENVRIFSNPRKLVDYASKINAENCTGDFLVAFAADNELASRDWLKTVAQLFHDHPDISAFWCNMIASDQDPRINKYYELIKSDPLSFFINKNLPFYIRNGSALSCNGHRCHLFSVLKDRPLVWGANGLVFRTQLYMPIMLREDYFGDNDVFQEMIENGNNLVAYSPSLAVYHHHLKSIRHWMNKWKRNYEQHTISHIPTRNMRWVEVRNLRLKVTLWIFYSLIPIVSLSHATYLAMSQRNKYWLYHPLASFLQAYFLLRETLVSKKGRNMILNVLRGKGISVK